MPSGCAVVTTEVGFASAPAPNAEDDETSNSQQIQKVAVVVITSDTLTSRERPRWLRYVDNPAPAKGANLLTPRQE